MQNIALQDLHLVRVSSRVQWIVLLLVYDTLVLMMHHCDTSNGKCLCRCRYLYIYIFVNCAYFVH